MLNLFVVFIQNSVRSKMFVCLFGMFLIFHFLPFSFWLPCKKGTGFLNGSDGICCAYFFCYWFFLLWQLARCHGQNTFAWIIYSLRFPFLLYLSISIFGFLGWITTVAKRKEKKKKTQLHKRFLVCVILLLWTIAYGVDVNDYLLTSAFRLFWAWNLLLPLHSCRNLLIEWARGVRDVECFGSFGKWIENLVSAIYNLKY
jgi:hypothetical protein